VLNLVGLLFLVLVVAGGVSVWQAVRATVAERQAVAARDRAEQEKDRAEQEKDRAEAGFRMARETVDRFFTQVAQSPQLKAPGSEKFRRELLENAKEFYERLIKEQPDVPSARHDLGLAHYRLAAIYGVLGDYAAARTMLKRAVDVLSELAHEHPDVPEYRTDLSDCYELRGRQCLQTGHPEAAEKAFEQARIIFQKLAEEHPETEDYRASLAFVMSSLGNLHLECGKVEAGEVELEQAMSVFIKLTQESPNRSRYRTGLAHLQESLGTAYASTGRSAKAEAILKDAQATYRALLQAYPDSLQGRLLLAGNFMQLGRLYHNNLRLADKAEATHQKALQIYEELAREHPDVLQYASQVGTTYCFLATAAVTAGRLDVALARYDKAIEILGGVVSKGYLLDRTTLYDAQINRAGALVGLGAYVRAIDAAEKLVGLTDLNWQNLYNLGCVFSTASAAAGNDTKLSSTERNRLKSQFADRAIDLLHQALAKGYRNLAEVKTDKDLDPLRARVDFQKLVQELEQMSKNR
jgi:tetratricopeptide (TPR) repeat protein